jgi:NTP pyrophosphatase (non-canonical NTP hydrolase)
LEGRFLGKELTIQQLQNYIKEFDYNPNNQTAYFLKLIEEVGELSEAIRKDTRLAMVKGIKGTIEEELTNVLYYVVALANTYNINLNECFWLKDELNKKKWNR